MTKKRRARSRAESRDPLDWVRRLQTALEDSESAVCLAAKTGGEYEEGVICGDKAVDRRHTISKAAYLSQMAECGFVLSTLPIDVRHMAHHTLSESRKARKSVPEVTHLPPKPVSINDASTWHFACGDHDAMFKPIDEGITLPSNHEYMSITTEGTSGADKALENALFLMAYRSVLSGLSILRGVRKALVALRVEKGNHREIRQQLREVTGSFNRLMEYKRPYDGRFAGVHAYNMTHHLMSAQPHTGLTMSRIFPDTVVNILPDSGIVRIIASHSADGTEEKQQEVENWMFHTARQLSDREHKRPFIDFVTDTFDTYIAPVDYREWPEEDKDALTSAAAASMNEFLSEKCLFS